MPVALIWWALLFIVTFMALIFSTLSLLTLIYSTTYFRDTDFQYAELTLLALIYSIT